MSGPLLNDMCLLTGKSQALFISLVMSITASAQKIATIEVAFHQARGVETPVSANIGKLTQAPASRMELRKVSGNDRTPVPFQMEDGSDRTITWMVRDDDKTTRYELIVVNNARAATPRIKISKAEGALTVMMDDKRLLRYQYETKLPPAGINEVFKRSGFIHPLWSPGGRVLTRIQPPDHYHHYGIWNPWTHVLFDGDTVDFWNLNARQGTVRFADFQSITNGDIFGEYAAVHHHVALGAKGERLAINEVQTVRLYAPLADKNYYIADITVNMTCPEKPVRLLEYRYGGLGWRATEEWTKDNSRVLTSEGKTRKEADGSVARWCIVEGTVDGQNAGVVMMSFPENYNHPEPLRIWPENANGGRGDMFANFSPTKNMDWQLQPRQQYVLKYRLIVFDGEFSPEKAEAAWQYFANPPTVTISP